eukprot:TRINITY_DN11439_c0_g1_i2.p2 TRINITY_DN11439_c0_g1~~TRINITY_DN11439_c0_g1_i2.p2  ORF type:complete len:129 (-),score=34.82 TRINITY_DN11439_c0_g1_i2:74-406(-)
MEAATPAAAEEAAAEYSWSQNHEEVLISVPVAASLDRRDVSCKFRKTLFELVVAGRRICGGDLSKEVDPEECAWRFEPSAEGGRTLVVSLAKVNRSALKSARVWEKLWAD